MIAAMFWGKVNKAWQNEHYQKLGLRMFEGVNEMPGFVKLLKFDAPPDGEFAIAYFDTEEHLMAWYHHPEHRAVQALGRREILDDYWIEIAHVTRRYTKASSNFTATQIEEQRADALAIDPKANIS